MIFTKDEWLSQTWGEYRLDPNQEFPDSWTKGTHKKFRFLCSCGRSKELPFNDISSGHSTCCRKCSYQTKNFWLSQQWGDLRLDPDQELKDEWGPKVAWKLRFLCNCGKSSTIPFYRATTGNSTTCGNCEARPIAEWLEKQWSRLKLDPSQELPAELKPTSHRKFNFICSCGKAKSIQFASVTTGNTESCGLCSYRNKTYWLEKRWGTLRLDPGQDLPDDIGHASHQKFRFLCTCGRTLVTSFNMGKNNTSCGKCNARPISFWLPQTWGKLRIDPFQDLPVEISPGSEAILRFICACGKTTMTSPYKVISGNTRSCGCLNVGCNEWSPAMEIYNYVKPFAPDAIFSHRMLVGAKRQEFDIFIPSKSIAIEYHGLYWHSEEFKGKGDYHKFLNSQANGIKTIQIYADRLCPEIH